MLGTVPGQIWPDRSSARTRAGDLKDQRDRAVGTLSEARRKLGIIRRQVRRIPRLENDITSLEERLAYLDAVLAVPLVGEQKSPEQPGA